MASDREPIKRLEYHNGSSRVVSRAWLETTDRKDLVTHLELRGFPTFEDDTTARIREVALDDYDGETILPARKARELEWMVLTHIEGKRRNG